MITKLRGSGRLGSDISEQRPVQPPVPTLCEQLTRCPEFQALLEQTGDMQKAVYDTDNDGKVNAAESADAVDWTGVQNVPSTFPPATHTHAQSEITGLIADLAGAYAAASAAQATANAVQTALVNKADLVGGVIPTSQIPSIAITEFLEHVADEPAMLALSGQRGDWCIRQDMSMAYVLTTEDPTQAVNWVAIPHPQSPVLSVNSQTGAVVLGKMDIGLSNVPNVDATVSSNINQDSTHRFVTDTQISIWNGVGTTLFLTTNQDNGTGAGNNTPSNITGLVTSPLATNSRWRFSGLLHVGCSGAGGVKFAVVLPSGATVFLLLYGFNSTSTDWANNVVIASATLTSQSFVNASNANGRILIEGEVEIGNTGGVVQFQFASGTATQTSTIFKTGTRITYSQII